MVLKVVASVADTLVLRHALVSPFSSLFSLRCVLKFLFHAISFLVLPSLFKSSLTRQVTGFVMNVEVTISPHVPLVISAKLPVVVLPLLAMAVAVVIVMVVDVSSSVKETGLAVSATRTTSRHVATASSVERLMVELRAVDMVIVEAMAAAVVAVGGAETAMDRALVFILPHCAIHVR